MDLKNLYEQRFPERELAQKNAIWQVLCRHFFSRFVRPGDTVVDIGAGYCEFINNIECRVKYAVDLNPNVKRFANPGIHVINEPCTAVATLASDSVDVVFMSNFLEHLPSKATETPHFDCRVWQVPTLADAADVFVWREDDATKNSITMAAGAYYSDAELDGKNSGVKQEMLWQKGVNWNDFPAFFKRGSYLQRRTFERMLSDEERARIPEAHRPPLGATYQRTQVVELGLPPVRKIANLPAVLFERAPPVPTS